MLKLLNMYIIFTDPTEKVTIQVLPQSSTIKEGDNITLKCSGNGNPPPQEFLFYIPVSPALLSLPSEIFCIIPSYRHCYMSVYTWFCNKWRKEFDATNTEDRHWPLYHALRMPHLSWQNIFEKTSPLPQPTRIFQEFRPAKNYKASFPIIRYFNKQLWLQQFSTLKETISSVVITQIQQWKYSKLIQLFFGFSQIILCAISFLQLIN